MALCAQDGCYRRFEGLEAATLLAQLYRSARLFENFFQSSFKLIAKQRDGARVHKTTARLRRRIND